MDFNGNELVDAVNKVLASTSRIPAWNTWTQWELESRRRKLSDDRAAQYNALQVLNAVRRAVKRTNYKVPPRIKSEHISKELYKLDEKERRVAKAFINELNGKIRQLSVAYTVVTSSYLLADEVFYRVEGHEPTMLRNAHGRWYRTESMRNVYAEMLKNSTMSLHETLVESRRTASLVMYDKYINKFEPQEDFESYKITGKAIVYAGTTAGGCPVLLSLNCTFDINGVIDGLPAGYRVIMFKPRTATITKKWVRRKKSEDKFEEG
jgi:hypothetical protein